MTLFRSNPLSLIVFVALASLLRSGEPAASEVDIAVTQSPAEDQTHNAELRSEVAVSADSDPDLTTPEAIPAIDAMPSGDSGTEESALPLANGVAVAEGAARPLTLLNATIPPGNYQRLSWVATELFEGVPVRHRFWWLTADCPGRHSA